MPRTASPLTIELTLLGLLRKSPAHGYDLYKAVCDLDGFGLIWKVKQSNLYALLLKLEAKGLLISSVVPGETHPSRREFAISQAGQDAFLAWMQSPVDSIRNMRQDFFARLYFAREAGSDQALRLIQKQREACLAWKRSIESKLAEKGAGGTYARIVLSHRLHIVQATLTWMSDYETRYA